MFYKMSQPPQMWERVCPSSTHFTKTDMQTSQPTKVHFKEVSQSPPKPGFYHRLFTLFITD